MLADNPTERSARRFLVSAARHYLSELRENRFATVLPEFLSKSPDLPQDTEFATDLPAEVAVAISDRAAELGVTTARLLRHAALLYLADLDAGRLAAVHEDRAPPVPTERPLRTQSPGRRPAHGG